jgi:hypothetical protein
MADIFISYSKADHSLALKLSAFLEAEGWTVWWDKSLAAADLYRDEIMKQLAAARAVITIWTPNSIRSDWVRAEAGRAKAEGKLIPVKTADVAYGDIPLPFGEMHTENIASNELIRAAVVAQLAKPAVEPSAVALLTKGFKYEVLTWVGIVGGALTLFTNLGAVLKLADWARLLVQGWKEWTHGFWVWAFGWVGIHLPPEWTPVLSFLLFGSLLTIGQAIQFRRTIKAQQATDRYQGKAFQLISWRTFLCVVCTLIVLGWSLPLLPFIFVVLPWLARVRDVAPGVLPIVYQLLFLVAMLASLVVFARHRLQTAVAALLLGIFWTIITFNQVSESESESAFFAAIAMLLVLSLILLSVAPAKVVSRRLLFLAIGLLLLIGLNELSKLGLEVTAPKLQG